MEGRVEQVWWGGEGVAGVARVLRREIWLHSADTPLLSAPAAAGRRCMACLKRTGYSRDCDSCAVQADPIASAQCYSCVFGARTTA